MAAPPPAPPRAAVWLRDEVFDHGVLHMVASHPHKPSLARVIAAITALRAASGPDGASVPAAAWPPVAAADLGWSAPEAALCAELFAELRGADGLGGGEGERLAFVPFALMLFAQGYVRARAAPPAKAEPNASWPASPAASGAASPTGSAGSSSEPWGSGGGGSPASPSSPGTGGGFGAGSSPREAGLARRPTEQAHRLLYVKRALPDVLRAVFGDSAAVPARAVNELAFLFCGGTTPAGRAPSLWTVSPWAAASAVGPTTTSLCEWLIVAAAPNEVAYPGVVAHSRPFSLSAGSGGAAAAPAAPGSSSPQSPGGARRLMPPTSPLVSSPGTLAGGGGAAAAAGAATGAPVPIGAGETPVVRPLVFSGAHKTTIIRTPGHADVHAAAGAVDARGGGGARELGDLRIDGCSDAYIYVLLPVRHVSIIGCTACVIVVGAVAGGLHVELCENVRVIATARRLRVSNSMECTFGVYTPSRPIVQGDCRGLALSPHCAQYAGMRAHLREARLPLPADAFDAGAARAAAAAGGNRWAEPLLVCTADDGASDVASAGGAAEVASTHGASRARCICWCCCFASACACWS